MIQDFHSDVYHFIERLQLCEGEAIMRYQNEEINRCCNSNYVNVYNVQALIHMLTLPTMIRII